MTFSSQLIKLHACAEAFLWAKGKTLKRAWVTCPRGDWMLWLAVKTGIDPKLRVLAACDCARTALKYVKQGELRPLAAIETAERWASGDPAVTLAMVEDAAWAAWAVADAAARAARAAWAAADAGGAAEAAFAAGAAADAAAGAAADAAWADWAVADAAARAARAAADAAGATARTKSLKSCAELVRGRITASMVSAALKKAK
jgi:hypothetical protein